MSTLYRPDHRAAHRRMPAATIAEQTTEAGVYLTDETFLYRIVSSALSEAGEIIDLEDCYSLDVVRVPANDLRAGQLRVVTPQPT